MTGNKRLWFKTRSYGWGWTPISWQGWLSVGLLVFYLAAVVLWMVTATPARSTSNDGLLKACIGFLLISAGIFVMTGIGFAKGEKPKWQWGTKKDKESDSE